jgi:hypothetical protein
MLYWNSWILHTYFWFPQWQCEISFLEYLQVLSSSGHILCAPYTQQNDSEYSFGIRRSEFMLKILQCLIRGILCTTNLTWSFNALKCFPYSQVGATLAKIFQAFLMNMRSEIIIHNYGKYVHFTRMHCRHQAKMSTCVPWPL